MGATKRVVDMTNVKEAGQFQPKHIKAGDYRAKIVAVDDHESKETKKPGWVFTIKLVDSATGAYPYYCNFEEKQLWKIRNLCIAVGINVPKKKVNIDPNKLVGKELGVAMDDDEYEGKMKSIIAGVFPASDLNGDSPDDDGGDEDDDPTEQDADDTTPDDDDGDDDIEDVDEL